MKLHLHADRTLLRDDSRPVCLGAPVHGNHIRRSESLQDPINLGSQLWAVTRWGPQQGMERIQSIGIKFNPAPLPFIWDTSVKTRQRDSVLTWMCNQWWCCVWRGWVLACWCQRNTPHSVTPPLSSANSLSRNCDALIGSELHGWMKHKEQFMMLFVRIQASLLQQSDQWLEIQLWVRLKESVPLKRDWMSPAGGETWH